MHRFTYGNQVQFLSDTLLMAFAFRKPKVLQGVPDGSRDIEAYRVGAGLCQVKRWRQPRNCRSKAKPCGAHGDIFSRVMESGWSCVWVPAVAQHVYVILPVVTMEGEDVSLRNQMLPRSLIYLSLCLIVTDKVAVRSHARHTSLVFATFKRVFLAVPQPEHHDDNVVR